LAFDPESSAEEPVICFGTAFGAIYLFDFKKNKVVLEKIVDKY